MTVATGSNSKGAMTMDRQDLADKLEREGAFEVYREASSGPRSKQVWLTEAERDEIVAALRDETEDHMRCCGTAEPQYNCTETISKDLERRAQTLESKHGPSWDEIYDGALWINGGNKEYAKLEADRICGKQGD